MAERVLLFEMGPRDGLQNEARMILAADKIRLVDMLTDAGFAKIETASFVSPKWVPQMADGAEVLAGIRRRDGARYTALTPNLKGYERAKAAGVDEIAIFGSASEGFSVSNLGRGRAEALEMFRPVAEAAAADNMPMRGYVSCVTDCPFDGPTPPEAVAEATAAMLALGCYEVSLGDTIGKGTPDTIAAMLDAALTAAPADRLAGHYHDTGGRRWRISRSASGAACGPSTPRWAASAGAPTPPAPLATSRRSGWRRGSPNSASRPAGQDQTGRGRRLRPNPEGLNMAYDTLTVETDARGVATLTLARPDKHNAMNPAMIDDLAAAAAALAADDSVRVVVMTGEGASFCAGGDLAWMKTQFNETKQARMAGARKLANALFALNTLPKPLIGRINGQAFGGGVGLIAVCDVAIAAKGAKFGLTEVRLGLIPATISPYVLTKMGEAMARRVFFSSRLFDADEAATLGLVANAVAPEDLDAAIEAEINPYLSAAPGAVARSKRLTRMMGAPITPEIIEATAEALADAWEDPESHEGVAAFFERRAPAWKV